MKNRTQDLVDRFKLIDAERMRGLPIYNSALSVEAINFQPIEIPNCKKALIGTLITPWFINVILMHGDEVEPLELGQRISYTLPAGDFEFMVGEDEELGRYDFHTLASPVLKYKSQHFAQSLAKKGLRKLLTPVDEPESTEHQVHFDKTHPGKNTVDNSRRALLRRPFERLQNS